MNVAFTICAKNRLASAKVCRDSWLLHHPGTDFIIILSDRISAVDQIDDAEGTLNCYVLKELPALANHKLEELAFKYDVTEFSTAIKPFCLEYLMWLGYDKVCYFDPDIKFYNKCKDLFNHDYELLSFDCVLTPHTNQPYPSDGKIPNDINILTSGIYNLGFCEFIATQDTIDFLRWWQNKVVDFCYNDVNNHMMTDQLWMNFAPAMLSTKVLYRQGYNIAYWNLHENKISKIDGKWLVNGEPLGFYHFSGLEYTNSSTISKHQNRYTLQNRPELIPLIYDYLNDIAKYDGVTKLKNKWYFENGLDQTARKSAAKYILSKTPDPFVGLTTFGLNVYGHKDEVHGVGEVERNFLTKINATAIPYITRKSDEEGIYDTSIYFVNLDMINNYKIDSNKLNIGVCWWEVDGPIHCIENAGVFDELVVYTNYVYDIFKKYLPDKRITKLSYPFTMPKQGQYDSDHEAVKRAIGLSSNDFMYHFSFNYDSCFERKNPLALIKAFAGCADLPNITLVIKTLNADKYPKEKELLYKNIKKYNLIGRVIVLDGEMTKYNTLSLINACDCYVSLHRSEGLGLTILEAASLGKPTVVTEYGGCLDFLHRGHPFLIRNKDITLERDIFEVYKQGSKWAEPNIKDAIKTMRFVYQDKPVSNFYTRQIIKDVLDYSDDLRFCSEFYKFMKG